MQYGTCTIQPTKIDFSSEELCDMIYRCGLNKLNQFAAFLAIHFRHARENPKLLDLLRNLDQVTFTGLPLEREEEDFALQKKIRLVVSNIAFS